MSIPLVQIAATFGFTLDDLAFNRDGKLSPHQVHAVVHTAVLWCVDWLALLLIVIATLFFARGAVRIFGIAAFLFMAPLMGFLGYRKVVAAVTQRVSAADGPLAFGNRGTIRVGSFYGLTSSSWSSTVLASGESYRVYYLSDSNDFLSIEPLSTAAASQPHSAGVLESPP